MGHTAAPSPPNGPAPSMAPLEPGGKAPARLGAPEPRALTGRGSGPSAASGTPGAGSGGPAARGDPAARN
eukprot:11161623-Lingulodinium_polyedra.AAC.1